MSRAPVWRVPHRGLTDAAGRPLQQGQPQPAPGLPVPVQALVMVCDHAAAEPLAQAPGVELGAPTPTAATCGRRHRRSRAAHCLEGGAARTPCGAAMTRSHARGRQECRRCRHACVVRRWCVAAKPAHSCPTARVLLACAAAHQPPARPVGGYRTSHRLHTRSWCLRTRHAAVGTRLHRRSCHGRGPMRRADHVRHWTAGRRPCAATTWYLAAWRGATTATQYN